MVPINRLLIITIILFCSARLAALPQKINIHLNPDSTGIGEITILKSGFLSRDSTVINYRKKDKTIIRVIENGKEVPAKRHHKYEKHVREVDEFEKMSELLPEIKELEVMLESEELTMQEKLMELKEIQLELSDMESELAEQQHLIVEVHRRSIMFDVMRSDLLNYLHGQGFNPPEDVSIIEVTRDSFTVDGVILADSLADNCYDIFDSHRGQKLGKGESVKIEF